jgi:hypothetical protein
MRRQMLLPDIPVLEAGRCPRCGATDSLDWFTHGWHAFVGAWLVVVVGMWAGLWLRGVNHGRCLTAPIAATFSAWEPCDRTALAGPENAWLSPHIRLP